MSTSIDKCKLVEARPMCDFHLKGQCFHPEKTKKGLVATGCQFHDCSQCTNKAWQRERVQENYTYYESILAATNIPSQDQAVTEKKPALSRIFSSKE